MKNIAHLEKKSYFLRKRNTSFNVCILGLSRKRLAYKNNFIMNKIENMNVKKIGTSRKSRLMFLFVWGFQLVVLTKFAVKMCQIIHN